MDPRYPYPGSHEIVSNGTKYYMRLSLDGFKQRLNIIEGNFSDDYIAEIVINHYIRCFETNSEPLI